MIHLGFFLQRKQNPPWGGFPFLNFTLDFIISYVTICMFARTLLLTLKQGKYIMRVITTQSLKTTITKEQEENILDLYYLMCEFAGNIRAFDTKMDLDSMKAFVALRKEIKTIELVQKISDELSEIGAWTDYDILIEENSVLEIVFDIFSNGFQNLHLNKNHLSVLEFLTSSASEG